MGNWAVGSGQWAVGIEKKIPNASSNLRQTILFPIPHSQTSKTDSCGIRK